MTIASKNSINLKLKEGKKWSAGAGFIIAKSINVGGKAYPLAGLDGTYTEITYITIATLCIFTS